jgi:hypothetical protein
MSKEIMSPKHPRWEEFKERLEGPEGCNFQEKDPGNPATATWTCGGGEKKDFAAKILQSMPEIDIEGSLRFFESQDGWCDCEILFNVEK